MSPLSLGVMGCVSVGLTFIQVNGNHTNPFILTKGIRQGDPLSPYLFIMCFEYLSRTINDACSSKAWTPFRVNMIVRKVLTFSSRMTSYCLVQQIRQLFLLWKTSFNLSIRCNCQLFKEYPFLLSQYIPSWRWEMNLSKKWIFLVPRTWRLILDILFVIGSLLLEKLKVVL